MNTCGNLLTLSSTGFLNYSSSVAVSVAGVGDHDLPLFAVLLTWPRHYACLLLTLLISFLVRLAVFRISKMVLFSVHDTLSIIIKNHISIASMEVIVCFVIDHDSHPYSSMGSM